jgi:hypothetical protein
VSEFVTGLADSFDIFRSRAEEVMYVLRGDHAAFLLVTAASRNALDEAAYFYDRIQEASLPFGGIIANRIHILPFPEAADPASATGTDSEGKGAEDSFVTYLKETRGLPVPVAEQLVENFNRYRQACRRDRYILQEFVKRSSREIPILTIPVFDEDIFDMHGLLKMNSYLFPSS